MEVEDELQVAQGEVQFLQIWVAGSGYSPDEHVDEQSFVIGSASI